MPTKLADTRNTTVEDAVRMFNQLANLELEIAKRAAVVEARIAREKRKHEDAAAPLVAERDRLAEQLREFILSRPDCFRRPRAIRTPLGRFGRRKVADVRIEDLEMLVDWAMENGYDDVMRVIHKPVKTAVAKRIRAGESVPGAALREGEEAFYAVDRALIREARDEAGG